MIARDSDEYGQGASSHVLDVERLVLPISSDRPTGRQLRGQEVSDSPYVLIRSKRTDARLRERGEGTVADLSKKWEGVLHLAEEILVDHSIDLEVSAYLIEAAVRLYSFSGFSDALCVLVTILEDYWETAHPAPSDSGHELRLTYVVGLNGIDKDGTLIAPLQRCPLVDGPEGKYSIADWVAAQAIEKLEPEQQRHHIDAGVPSLESILDQAQQTPADFVAEQRTAIHQSLAWIGRLVDVVDSRCPPGILHVSRMRNVLVQALETMTYLYGPETDNVSEVVDSVQEPSTSSSDDNVESSLPEQPAILSDRPAGIQSRNEALQQLMEVAEWFRQTEPHSPLSYTIEQIVRRAQMPLPELLEHLIPDSEARSLFLSLSAMASPLDQNQGVDEPSDA